MMRRSSKWVNRYDLCTWRRDQKRKTKEYKPYCSKLGIRLGHPRHRIEVKFCARVVGGGSYKLPSFIKIRWSASETSVEVCPFPLLWPLAYTTAACTTVQAVIRHILQMYVSDHLFCRFTGWIHRIQDVVMHLIKSKCIFLPYCTQLKPALLIVRLKNRFSFLLLEFWWKFSKLNQMKL